MLFLFLSNILLDVDVFEIARDHIVSGYETSICRHRKLNLMTCTPLVRTSITAPGTFTTDIPVCWLHRMCVRNARIHEI